MSTFAGPFNFLNGKRVDPIAPTRSRPVTNPATGSILCQMPLSNKEDVDHAVSNAFAAFPSWSKTNGHLRGAVLNKAADIIDAKLEELALYEVQDSGKPISEARFDISACAQAFRFFGSLAGTQANLGQQIPQGSQAFIYTLREALGVCAGIGAWNFPFLIATWKSAPALACGNVFVYKPSEFTPITAVVLAEVLSEAGLPAGCFNIVQGEGDVGQELCLHPDIAKVSFTGSVSTGAKVMSACSEGIKKVTLELGGKSPLIIFEDCDLENAVKATMMANFLSQGQVCSNASRVFVQKSIASAFLEKLVAATKKLKIGDPECEDTHIGATINEGHAKKILNYITKAKKEGATILCGGERVDLQTSKLKGGYYLGPCILTDLHDGMEIVKEEVFGAVASILEFETEQEVLKRANNTSFGLAGGVFTRDLARGHRVAAALEAGSVWINNYNVYPPDMPFGGYKKSGIGRENGLAVLEHYTQLKSVYVELGDVDCPLYT